MINKVWLRHWKAYDSLDLELQAGTTFVVAKNGIGKSSIVQGLHFAFFGSKTLLGTEAPLATAIRGEEGTAATVGCRILLGSKEVELERSVERTATAPRIRTTIHIDGAPATEADWLALLAAETGVDATQLGLLAFVHEGATISVEDAGISTIAMLSNVFGVDRLRRLAFEFEQQAKRLNRDNDSLRKSQRDVPHRDDVKRSADLRSQLSQLEATIESLRRRLADLEHHQMLQSAWADFHESEKAFKDAVQAEQRQIASLLGKLNKSLPALNTSDFGMTDRAAIDLAARRISERRDMLMLNRGAIQAGRTAALGYLETLRAAEPVCPLCRQPLAPEDAQRAIAEHDSTLEQADAELRHIDYETNVLSLLMEELDQLTRAPALVAPSAPVRPPTDDMGDATADLGTLRAELDAQTELRGTLLSEIRTIEQLEEQRKQNFSLSERLFEGYRAAERAQLAAITMNRLAGSICAERIRPLAAELEKRSAQMGSTSMLTMDGTGALAMEESGYVVPYSGFSGGQRTLAQLEVRLLALQMATRSPFLILDEPLEHLDPRNRRALATLLGQVTRGSARLRQVIVTTYEESVTRRLSSGPVESSTVDKAADDAPVHVVRILPSGLGSGDA
jgi:DNA repair exonuclease SbcCD ATPase subunit